LCPDCNEEPCICATHNPIEEIGLAINEFITGKNYTEIFSEIIGNIYVIEISDTLTADDITALHNFLMNHPDYDFDAEVLDGFDDLQTYRYYVLDDMFVQVVQRNFTQELAIMVIPGIPPHHTAK
jgi:hypothetical protein